MRSNSSVHLLMIVARFPHAKMDAKNPLISISCFLLNRCGMHTGSLGINSGELYLSTSLSKYFFDGITGQMYKEKGFKVLWFLLNMLIVVRMVIELVTWLSPVSLCQLPTVL